MGSLFEIEAEETILHGHFAWLVEGLEWIAAGIDLFAILVLLIGAARFIAGCAVAELAKRGADRVESLNVERVELGRYILAGLELFIVSDVIHTALSLAMQDLVFLGVLVLIRSVISFFLEREIQTLKKELGT